MVEAVMDMPLPAQTGEVLDNTGLVGMGLIITGVESERPGQPARDAVTK